VEYPVNASSRRRPLSWSWPWPGSPPSGAMATTLEAEVGLKSGSLYPILMRLADRGSWTLLGRWIRRSGVRPATCTAWRRRACPWSPRCERPQPDANRDSTWARRRDRRADRPDPARHNYLGARPGRSNDSGASRHVAASGARLLGPGFHTQLDQARNRRSRQVRSA